jgi:hypothetical protein
MKVSPDIGLTFMVFIFYVSGCVMICFLALLLETAQEKEIKVPYNGLMLDSLPPPRTGGTGSSKGKKSKALCNTMGVKQRV